MRLHGQGVLRGKTDEWAGAAARNPAGDLWQRCEHCSVRMVVSLTKDGLVENSLLHTKDWFTAMVPKSTHTDRRYV